MSDRKKVIVFLCTDYMGVANQIAELSDSISSLDTHLVVVTDHVDTTSMLQSSNVLFRRTNIIFMGNDSELFESLADIKAREIVCNHFDINNSYANLLSVDYDRFDTLGLTSPASSLLGSAFLEFVNMFQYLHANFEVIASFSEGPHNFFLRSYDAYRDGTRRHGRYIYLRPGRVGDSFYLQDADSKVTVLKDSGSDTIADDVSPFYMSEDAPLMRSISWKIRNSDKTSLYYALSKIWRTKSIRLNFFDKPNVISLILALWLRELRSYYVTISGGTNKFISEDIPPGKIVVYPEHYHPEASTSAYDFTLRNDYENAIRIRKALPEEYTLLYKLHPSNKNRHPTGMLHKISKLPGVLLVEKSLDIRCRTPAFVLISVSSTMILDYVENDKPALVIGSPEFCSDTHLKSRLLKTSIEKFEQNPTALIGEAVERAKNSEAKFSRAMLVGSLYTPKRDLVSIISKLVEAHTK